MRQILLVILLVVIAHAKGQVNRFDVNLDRSVNVSDVTSLVDYILSGHPYNVQYDVYEDGKIDVVDVTTLVDYILGKGPIDSRRHDYVDLGLQSGTLWATCNIGAESETGYGDYFSWGEVNPKNDYTRASYLYYVKGNYQNIGANISGTGYDAAHVNWGGTWRLPTLDDMNELMQCTWQSKTVNSIHGYQVTGSNGNSIFLPCAGFCYDGSTPSDLGVEGYYWTGTMVAGRPSSSYCISTSDIGETWWTSKYFGYSIRPVRSR